ncbi:hypothetical protein L596_023686 [Steinernema carpocapsae]|uniref:Uncharacterized protein n=1 Tax=Steinernema carpocapsae TaxID=34508 RepID=A0A4U5MED7_STECR|nr:hypothetical protein L596_023686 [Steinernema carpocapsae]
MSLATASSGPPEAKKFRFALPTSNQNDESNNFQVALDRPFFESAASPMKSDESSRPSSCSAAQDTALDMRSTPAVVTSPSECLTTTPRRRSPTSFRCTNNHKRPPPLRPPQRRPSSRSGVVVPTAYNYRTPYLLTYWCKKRTRVSLCYSRNVLPGMISKRSLGEPLGCKLTKRFSFRTSVAVTWR